MDSLNPDNWTGNVYYDSWEGKFVTFEFNGGEIRETAVFRDTVLETYDREAFIDEVESDVFTQVDKGIVDNPASVLEAVVRGAAVRPTNPSVGYSGMEIDYARNACDIVTCDEA